MLQWYYLTLISGILLSITILIEKHMLKREHATSYTAITTLVTTALALFFLPNADFNITPFQVALIYVSSTLFIAGSLLIARLFRHRDASTTSPISSTLPLMFVVILAYIFLGETLTMFQYIGIVILIAATYKMLGDIKASEIPFIKKNAIYFVSAALLGSVGGIILKYLLSSMNIYTYLILSQIFMSINVMAFVLLRFKTLKYIVRDLKEYKVEVFALCLSSLGFGIAYFLAVSITPISIVLPLRNSINVILTVFASGALLKEDISKRIPLAIIMIVAMYLIIT